MCRARDVVPGAVSSSAAGIFVTRHLTRITIPPVVTVTHGTLRVMIPATLFGVHVYVFGPELLMHATKTSVENGELRQTGAILRDDEAISSRMVQKRHSVLK